MTTSRYLLGLLALVAVAAPHVAVGWAVQRALPRRSPSLHVLAAVIVGTTSLLVVAEVLGTVGLFRLWALLVAGLPVAAAAVLVVRATPGSRGLGAAHRRRPRPGALPEWTSVLGVVGAGGVLVRWLASTARTAELGIFEIDSRTYHLPFAAEFVRTGWVSRFHHLWPDPVHVFYPANGELLQAVAMAAMGRDVLAPLFGLGWVVVLLLAGWCAGVRDRVPGLTLLGVSWVAGIHLVVATNAGPALSEPGMLAGLVAAVACWRVADGDRRWLTVSGLALGLSVGTKLTVAGVAVVFVAAAVLLAPAARRKATAVALLGGAAVSGGYWFVRNLLRTGSPVPHLDLPLLPSADLPVIERFGRPVAHYLTDAPVWSFTFRPAIADFFGAGGAVFAIGLGLAVISTFAERPLPRPTLALYVMAGAGFLGYLVAPAGAWGPEGAPDPLLFEANLRYVLPAVAVAALAIAWSAADHLSARVAAAIVLGFAVGWNVLERSGFEPTGRYTTAAVAVVAVLVALGAIAWARPRFATNAAVGVVAVVVLLAVTTGGPIADDQLASTSRFSATAPEGQAFTWAETVRPARIGFYGFDAHYPLYGPGWENDLQYLGVEGANGSYRTPRTCEELVEVLTHGSYDYVLLGPPERYGEDAALDLWTVEQPGATLVLFAPPYTAFATPGPFDERHCPDDEAEDSDG